MKWFSATLKDMKKWNFSRNTPLAQNKYACIHSRWAIFLLVICNEIHQHFLFIVSLVNCLLAHQHIKMEREVGERVTHPLHVNEYYYLIFILFMFLCIHSYFFSNEIPWNAHNFAATMMMMMNTLVLLRFA